jgi:chemotaxis protein histidine kinase CheA/ActR/RegA family two-component response regulator
MITGFSIDDVRGTLTTDITRFLGRIETTARELSELAVDNVAEAIPMFQTIGDNGHAIFGTTSLVSAESLSSSAMMMERMALLGRDDLARAARHLERARKIAEVLSAGAGEMLAMLSLELDDRPIEATKIAAGWRSRAEETLAAAATAASAVVLPPADEPPPPANQSEGWAFDEDNWSEGRASEVAIEAVKAEPIARSSEADFSFASSVAEPVAPLRREFSFASSEAESSIDVDTGAIDVELALIFEEEARGTLDRIDEHLTALSASPSDRTLFRDLERAFHTLKGAAATVGLTALSEQASELQHRAEALFESAEPVTPDVLATLRRDTQRFRRAMGLAPDVPAPARSSVASASIGADGMRAEFEREAQLILDDCEHLVGRIAEVEGEQRDEIVAELAKNLHRLHGSALVVGALAVGRCAEQLEQACRAAADAVDLAAGLARCAALVKDELRGPPASNASSAQDMRALFLSEARTIHREATALVRNANDPDQREALRRLAHRLKGSAAVAWEDAITREATALHADLEGGVESAALEARLVRIGELVGDDGTKRPAPTRTRITIPIPDAELEAGFQQECAELLDALDRNVIGLERSERPRDVLKSLLGAYHTLKGAVNAIGLRPTGDQVHRVEDFVEQLHRATIIPPLKGVTSVLLQLHVEIRQHLKTVPKGYVEVSPAHWDQRLHRVLAGESRATSGVASTDVSQLARLGDGSEATGTGTGTLDGADRKHIRVSIDRLDALMNLAGELVINRSRLLSRIDALQVHQSDLGRSSRRLTEIVERFREEHEFSMVARTPQLAPRAGQWGAFSELELDRYEDVNILARTLAESSTDMQDVFTQLGGGLSSLVDDSDALGTIISGMQGEITRARMVPLGSLFSRLQLPIRDAAQREQREVRIITEGDDVHLDKTIVDALLQPLLHLVRNSVSHGLESPARRAALGKHATGVIRLRARQELGQIAVEVVDDGSGLDLAKLHARGVAMGLITASLPIDDPKVKDLVFVPGLSTVATAGAVAGRGVGCDVVRRAIERLNGSIRVETVPGRSTSFVITLPVTLAITRALLFQHGAQTFAVPLNFTERILDVQDRELLESAGRRRIELEDGFANVRSVGEFLAGTTSTRESGPVVILRVGDQRLVVQVDAVAAQEEVVVKGLGTLLTGHPLFAGVTIRGTGEIVLILDVPSLVENALARDAAPGLQATLPEPTATVDAAVEQDIGKGPLRVLFVDDSVSVRKVAERALESLGVAVTLAVDGIDALEKLHAQPFDLVFTDLEMPRMHGYELIREMRFLPAFRNLPVIVVTSRSGKKHREEAHALGATHYMTKPFSPQSLEAALEKFGGTPATRLAISSEGDA